MSMKQTLTTAAICAIALVFDASAGVAYDREYTNEWFEVIAKDANLGDTDRWVKPQDGTVAVDDLTSRIRLDTDLGDPLVYTATNQSGSCAIVTARFEATANTAVPELGVDSPQAALTVVVNGAATNWCGLVGADSANTWVLFTNEIPEVGTEYDIRIEFDLRANMKKIRYSVGGKVLVNGDSADGWYDNPKADAVAIRSVSFAGTGDIGDFRGDNVGEVTPVASVTGTSQTDGFDYTNGTFNVTLSSVASGTATLKVVDFATGETKTYSGLQVSAGSSTLDWQIADQIDSLVPGGTYGYELTITPGSTDETHGAVTKTGTFVAANPTNAVNWFSADATSGTGVEIQGHWDETMTVPPVEGRAYMIDDSKFVVETSSVGSNNLVCVDTSVTFESMVDGGTLEPVDGAFGGFVAATEGGANVWMALTAGTPTPEWVALQGDIAPEVNTPYVIRAEVSFIVNNKKVRYLVKRADDAEFCALTHSGSQWLELADAETTSLEAVEMQGSGALAKLEANITDKALFEVNDKKFDTMEAALEAAGTNVEHVIKLLTNATIEPTEQGKYEIAAGGHQYVSGGKVSSGDKTIIIDNPGEPPVVRPTDTEMQKVKAPGGKSYKNYDSLRKFLEKNKVGGYTNENADAQSISNALETTGANSLKLWQDYALGIDVGTSVDPVTTPAGDTDANNITLAIPAIDTSKYSKDYTILYQVMKGGESVKSVDNPSGIQIPLTNGTGTYKIKAVFTPAN